MTPSAINPISVAFNPRCLHIYDNGARCRLPARYPELAFCPRHISLPEHQYARSTSTPSSWPSYKTSPPPSLSMPLSRVSSFFSRRVASHHARPLPTAISLISCWPPFAVCTLNPLKILAPQSITSRHRSPRKMSLPKQLCSMEQACECP